jgi:hypothetical protein
MVAAACENSATSVFYFLLRRNPDSLVVNAPHNICDAESANKEDRKRRGVDLRYCYDQTKDQG